jgi:hypothetical protein
MGMAVSAMSREAKQAMFHTVLVVGLLAGILPALWWLPWITVRLHTLDLLLWPSPAYAYMNAFDSRYRLTNGPHEFWLSLGTVFALGCAGIVLACVVLPRSWREGNAGHAAPGEFIRPGSLPGGNRGRFRLGDWSFEPMYWLAVRDPSPQLLAVRALVILAPVWLIAFLASMVTAWKKEAFLTALFIAYGMHLVVKALVATEASRRMNEDRRSGAWELLLATPLRVETILDGQAKALHRHFLGAMITLLVVNATMLYAVVSSPKALEMSSLDQTMFTGIFFGGGFVMYTDFYALSWVGMWRGLRSRKHPRAVLETLAQIILPPVAVIFLLMFLEPNVGGRDGPVPVMLLWFLAGVVIDVVSAQNARARLLTEFRSAVLERVRE